MITWLCKPIHSLAMTGLLTFASVSSSHGQTLRVDRLVRISAAEEDLTSVGGIAVGNGGTIMVSQFRDARVVFFDRTGKRVGVLGRSGSGPGEFASIARIGRFEDAWWIDDPGLRRFTLVGNDFRVLRIMRYPMVRGTEDGTSAWRQVTPLALRQDGSVVYQGTMEESGRLPSWHPKTPRGGLYLFRVDSAGEFRELLGRRKSGECTVQVSPTLRAGVPFCVGGMIAVSPDGSRGILVDAGGQGASDKSHVLRSFGIGETRQGIAEVQFTPIPLPRQRLDSALRARAEMLQIPAREFVSKVPGPAYYSPVEDGLVGNDGAVWLEESRVASEHRWLVMSPSGRVIGRLRLPANHRVVAVEPAFLWTIERDEDGFDNIVKWALVR